MAIMKCNECGAEISDKASACVACGAPITAVTGRGAKALQLFGFAVLALGVILAVSDAKSGVGLVRGHGPLIIALGIAFYAAGRISDWWKRG